MQAIDEIGNRYGRLEALGRSAKQTTSAAYWVCECGCGNFTIVSGGNLRAGSVISCGCMRYKVNHRLPKGVAAMNVLYAHYGVSAKRRNLVFEIDKEAFRKLTKSDCCYCGAKPSQELHRTDCNGNYVYNGLDRVDNNIGYVIDNIVPCCGQCNVAKSNLSKRDFLDWTERVSSYQYKI